jgi:hypothetical protein
MLNLLQLNEKNKRQVRRAGTFLASVFFLWAFLLLRQPLLMRLEQRPLGNFFIRDLWRLRKKAAKIINVFPVKMGSS